MTSGFLFRDSGRVIEMTVRASDVIATWNRITSGKLPQARVTDKRTAGIQVRMKDPRWFEDFKTAARFIADSSWHRGANDRGWVATIDYLLRAGKATELAEKASTQPVVQRQAGSENQLQSQINEEQAFRMWQSMPERFKAENPWRGRNYDKSDGIRS